MPSFCTNLTSSPPIFARNRLFPHSFFANLDVYFLGFKELKQKHTSGLLGIIEQATITLLKEAKMQEKNGCAVNWCAISFRTRFKYFAPQKQMFQKQFFQILILSLFLLACNAISTIGVSTPNTPQSEEASQATILIEEGKQKLLDNDLVGALANFNEAITLDPDNAEAYLQRGMIFAMQDERVAALADIEKAIILDPTNSLAYYTKAVIAYEQGDPTTALANYTLAIDQDPNYLEAIYNRGLLHKERGELDLALADIDRAIEIDPLFPRGYAARGDIYQQQNRLALAQADYTKAIELDPTLLDAYYNRAFILGSQNQFEAAIADYLVVVGEDPTNVDALSNLGYSYYATEQFSEAFNYLGQALQLDPRHELARGNMATLFVEQVLIGLKDLPAGWTSSYEQMEDAEIYFDDQHNGVYRLQACDIVVRYYALAGTDGLLRYTHPDHYAVIFTGFDYMEDAQAATDFLSDLQAAFDECYSMDMGGVFWFMEENSFPRYGNELIAFRAAHSDFMFLLESLNFIFFRQENVVVTLVYYQDQTNLYFTDAEEETRGFVSMTFQRLLNIWPR